MNTKTKGTICGVIAAVSYGTNPLGALSLYEQGINVNSVLFYRYAIAAAILAIWLFIKKESFKIDRRELKVVVLLGLLFATSSLTLFTSFHFIDAGVASTILFIYPIMVALIMTVCFKERLSFTTIFSIILSLSGIALLSCGNDGATLNMVGMILILVSALTYAFYIVILNKSNLSFSPVKLTLYVLLFSVLTIAVYASVDANSANHIQLLTTVPMWLYASMLALVPTIISLLTMTVAVNSIGSTPTAIMGALEPLTAIIIGVTLFGEQLSIQLTIGVMLILFGVLLIIGGHAIQQKVLHRLQKNRLRIKHKF